MRNNTISELDNELTRRIISSISISSRTMRIYILSMVPLVEKSVRLGLLSKLFILFDGWSDSGVHFVEILATHLKGDQFKEELLAISPLPDEGDLFSKQHNIFIMETLGIYQKDLSNVVALFGDNCSVNKSISTLIGILLIGSASHKFNLAVEAWINSVDGL